MWLHQQQIRCKLINHAYCNCKWLICSLTSIVHFVVSMCKVIVAVFSYVFSPSKSWRPSSGAKWKQKGFAKMIRHFWSAVWWMDLYSWTGFVAISLGWSTSGFWKRVQQGFSESSLQMNTLGVESSARWLGWLSVFLPSFSVPESSLDAT